MSERSYVPGDPVLVAGSILDGPDRENDYLVRVDVADADWRELYIPASDVHPVPSTPDPRNIAIAAVRALCDENEKRSMAYGAVPISDVRRALDGVAPVTVSPAPTSTGWTAEEGSAYLASLHADAAAVPVTTDDGRTGVVLAAAPGLDRYTARKIAEALIAADRYAPVGHEGKVETVRDVASGLDYATADQIVQDLDTHRAARSPS